ncbi:MAG: hypothetical protein MRERC_7c005 [Mycoplasmataceae bacterium RC_NB112A]|nr:MAG: hypothetical protein MRERC_10c050 [Mycoplasmataceae bacterium RC_NB112A]KLL01855.1 MAG: hypothetical protein MRERC_7c005 [Mycoplasmataceae bacterium RC_NB112A]
MEELKKNLPKVPPYPQNGRFSALVPTKKEQEYQKGEGDVPLPISSVVCGTDRPEYWDYI